MCHTSTARRDRMITTTAAVAVNRASRMTSLMVHLFRGARRTRTSDLFVISEAL
jgi:hypothetical protein